MGSDRYSIFTPLRESLRGHIGWQPAWREPELVYTRSRNFAASGPGMLILPCVVTSQKPTVLRTARTSRLTVVSQSVSPAIAREVLQRIVDSDYDISNSAFPYMAAANVTICDGVAARLFRLSFSGELAYELAAPARFGDSLARRLVATGADLGNTPYGTEALGVMRIEKEHPAGGELTGQTTAYDLGMARLLSRRKDFVGRAMAGRPTLTDPGRPRLICLRPVQRNARLRAGAHLLAQGATPTAANDQGWITSAASSPTLGRSIALAMLTHGPERMGEMVRVYDPVRNSDLLAEVVSPVFVDPEGARLHG